MRLIFYLCQAVTEQDNRAESGKPWNYDFPPVLVIMLCNFVDPELDRKEVNYFGLINLETGRMLSEHVGLCLVQIPLFPIHREDCKTDLERIVFSMDNMEGILANKVESFSTSQGDFYDRIEKMSQTATLTQDELHEYHQWLKVTNDDRLFLERAIEKGMAEGRAEGRAKGEAEQAWRDAEGFYKAGVSLEIISSVTKIPIEELQSRLNR
ncbi:MAG: PD-(D/E)XK nuclease family transposase [Muribaculaceae bacterium]|nr:PD-(D/E)XK nuclease family transposase [Muribaculaceae bacterium]